MGHKVASHMTAQPGAMSKGGREGWRTAVKVCGLLVQASLSILSLHCMSGYGQACLQELHQTMPTKLAVSYIKYTIPKGPGPHALMMVISLKRQIIYCTMTNHMDGVPCCRW